MGVCARVQKRTTPLHEACSKGRTRAVRALLEECKVPLDPKTYQVRARALLTVRIVRVAADWSGRLQCEQSPEPRDAVCRRRVAPQRTLRLTTASFDVCVCSSNTELIPTQLTRSGSESRDWRQHSPLAVSVMQDGETPLHSACLSRHADVVRYLVQEAKCDISVRCKVRADSLRSRVGTEGLPSDCVCCLRLASTRQTPLFKRTAWKPCACLWTLASTRIRPKE